MNNIIETTEGTWDIISASIGMSGVAGIVLLFFCRFRVSDLIERVWPTWVYDHNDRKTRFTCHDVRYLFRKGLVGDAGNRWCFFNDCTAEIARKALEADAARSNAHRREDYERRPRWNWEKVEHPEFDTAVRISDRIFKFFQSMLVAVAIKAIGQRTHEPTLSAIGSLLSLAAAAPYFVLLNQFALARYALRLILADGIRHNGYY